MKIKTISRTLNDTGLAEFDEQVNAAMTEGWRLIKRELIPGANQGTVYFAPCLYAELVQLDPEPEPEAQPADPFDALRAVQAFCLSTSVDDCNADRCPLAIWCKQLPDTLDPTDWRLPEKEGAPT